MIVSDFKQFSLKFSNYQKLLNLLGKNCEKKYFVLWRFTVQICIKKHFTAKSWLSLKAYEIAIITVLNNVILPNFLENNPLTCIVKMMDNTCEI